MCRASRACHEPSAAGPSRIHGDRAGGGRRGVRRARGGRAAGSCRGREECGAGHDRRALCQRGGAPPLPLRAAPRAVREAGRGAGRILSSAQPGPAVGGPARSHQPAVRAARRSGALARVLGTSARPRPQRLARSLAPGRFAVQQRQDRGGPRSARARVRDRLHAGRGPAHDGARRRDARPDRGGRAGLAPDRLGGRRGR